MLHPLQRIRVLVIDDHPLIRGGIVGSVNDADDMVVIGEASNGREAVAAADDLLPDVILCDINMPDTNGINVARTIKKRHPNVRIVMISMHEEDEQLFGAIRAGAAAYLTKDSNPDLIVDYIRRVYRHEYLINDTVLTHPLIANQLLDDFQVIEDMTDEMASMFSPLTAREDEILRCVAGGNSNKQIGVILGISDQTVKNHVTSILRKLQVNDRTQAVLYGLRHGWVRLPTVQPAEV